MKQLTCEMCGSTELIKQDGFFVCQACGCKYSVEEAKKMMIEGTVEIQGTVKIDKTDSLEKLYQLARRAKEIDDLENAQKYYEMILLDAPKSWEAQFYSIYFESIQTSVANMESATNKVKNNLSSTISLIKDNLEANERIKAVEEVTIRTCRFMELIAITTIDLYKKHDGANCNGYKNRVLAAISSLFYLFSLVHEIISIEVKRGIWGSMLKIYDVNTNKYKFPIFSIDLAAIRNLQYSNDPEAKEDVYNTIVYKITNNQILPGREFSVIEDLETLGDYKESKKYIELLKKKEDERIKPQSGGCYVATCVYGSYDCPEVWTLRRYRDDTLGSTWYGRAFIKLYYAISPTLVKWFGKTKWFKRMWKGKLDRMVKKLQDNGVESTPYQDKEW